MEVSIRVEGAEELIAKLTKLEQMTAETGIELVPIWLTANDEMVCPVCGPRHKKPIKDGIYPPLHPRCRCGTAYEPKKVSK